MKISHIACSVILTLTAACSSDESSAADTGGGNTTATDGGGRAATPDGGETPAKTTTVPVTASAGGEVALDDAKLSVAADSLPDDTDITVEAGEPAEMLPERETVQGLQYDFGPDGTEFDPPATLTLPLPEAPPEGKHAVISWLDESTETWVDVPTTVQDGTVSAEVEHFTLFVVRLRDYADVPVDCSFSACGGDLVGDWTITSACLHSNPTDNPFQDVCPAATFDTSLDAMGTATFGADGSYSSSVGGSTAVAVDFPGSCLADAMLSSCADLAMQLDDMGGVTCTGDASTSCTCDGTLSNPVDDVHSGTFTADGNQFTTMEAGKMPESSDYCVTGDILKVQTTEGDLIIAQRQ